MCVCFIQHAAHVPDDDSIVHLRFRSDFVLEIVFATLFAAANTCTCTEGTAAVASDGSCDVDGVEDCTACAAGYSLNGQVGR
jgi:hypothetical protein